MRSLKIFIFIICQFLFQNLSFSQINLDITEGVKLSEAIISRYQPTINTMTGKDWEYSNSIILHGMEKINEHVNKSEFLNYIKNYVDTFVSSNGDISDLSVSLDKIHPGLLLLYLYEETGDAKYQTAATNLRNYILSGSTFPATPDGGYWHKNTTAYNQVMMLDGIYMAHPFLAKYAFIFNDPVALDTATSQTLMLAERTYNSNLHLSMHAWHYPKSKTWCDPATGVSREVWSRAMGWYMMAIVDILKYLPSSHADYQGMHDLLDSLVIGIKNTQDPSTGLWWQVMDKSSETGNYLETSGSAMFVYALKTALDSNWIEDDYLEVVNKGWVGVKSKITLYTDGMPQIKDFAEAMSVQSTYFNYVNSTSVDCPAPYGIQHPHGYAAVLMASSVMEFPVINSISNHIIKKISVYPNPSKESTINLRLNFDPGSDCYIQLVNSKGKICFIERSPAIRNRFPILITLPTLPEGLYLLKVNCSEKEFWEKLIIE